MDAIPMRKERKSQSKSANGHFSLVLSLTPPLKRADASPASSPSKCWRLDALSISLLQCSGPAEVTFGAETRH